TGNRIVALAENAEALGDFAIGLDQPAEIAAEAVLVHLLVGFHVPEAARIRADLVGDDDPHHVVLPQAAALHLEIDKTNAGAQKQAREEVVDADRERHDVVDFLRRGPAEGRDVLFGHHRVSERIVLVMEFDDRARELRAFLDAEARRQRTRRDIAHHAFERDDLDFADQLLAHVQAAHEMRRYADIVQILEDVFRNPVVEHALAIEDVVLLRVEGSRIVLEVLDERSRLGTLIKDLRLAFVNSAAAVHSRYQSKDVMSGDWAAESVAGWAIPPRGKNLAQAPGRYNAAKGPAH